MVSPPPTHPPTPGILYVTMQPSESLKSSHFHDWYNNEHGPNRLRLPFVENGFRYRATDIENGKGSNEMPEWMAIYDISDMKTMNEATYLKLRDPKVQTQRERDTMKQIKVDRRLLDLTFSRASEKFVKLESMSSFPQSQAGNVMIAVSCDVKNGHEKEFDEWYETEHVPLLSKVPGWLRTRRFVTSKEQNADYVEHLALHEYLPENGLGGEEFVAATTTEWAKRVMAEAVTGKRRRVYELVYIFGEGGAARELGALVDSSIEPWVSTDGKDRTFPVGHNTLGKWPAIESYITTPDGVELPYRLEGNGEPEAPLVVLSNSVMVDWTIWDSFVASFLTSNPGYRVLRYNTRGRTSLPTSETNITLDVLAADIVTLLDSLRVPKAAAVIGVSLGGATALRTALSYPARVGKFVSCDTSATAPAGNQKVWEERIAVAESEALTLADGGEKVVGEELAELTVRRWFVPESYEREELLPRLEDVKRQVRENSLQGFKAVVKALWEYDMAPEMKDATVPGLFLVGGGDGVLPGVMEKMAGGYGAGKGKYVVVEGAGHLPMVEKPGEVAEAVGRFVVGK